MLLQKAMKEFLVGQVSSGGIAKLTDPILRAAAFDSHPKGYLDGGLLDVSENSQK